MKGRNALLKKPLAFFFLGILLLIVFLYWGLNTAEKGMQEILALEGPSASLRFELTDEELLITFAGDHYLLPYKSCLEKTRRFFSF